MSHPYTNALIDESSPYLLQHAHNPVNWYPWKPEVLHKAQQDNKLLIISIGYAACHWCHVMEEECFENEAVAKTMNAHFINIKVDREERPDVDHIYMDALQMMSGHGGWPLNIVALPDGRPFWGATYVRKDQWIRALEQLAEIYRNEPEKLVRYAEDLSAGIRQINLIKDDASAELMQLDQLGELVKNWYRYFDTKKGGYNRAPKFMMPGNLDFLLHYAWETADPEISAYVDLTLTKMAYGGIFDQVGGGFARYSVDTKWHVPHFEKMLYDNALLTSLYSKAYAHSKNELYKEIAQRTIAFLVEELRDKDGGFYSSLDADSLDEQGELEEGAFYVWTKRELKDLLGEHYGLIEDYYNINNYGHWEKDVYVLIRDQSDADLAEKHQISIDELRKIVRSSRELLKKARAERPRPRLDDKILCSWNGLMLTALTDASKSLGEASYLEYALKLGIFIENNFLAEDGGLYHNYKDGKANISGYLEDYAAIIEGYIGLYELCLDEKWIFLARDLVMECIADYYDSENQLFYFTSKKDPYVIRRTLETGDNVIPSSNSIMCKNLFKLSRIFLDSDLEGIAKAMVAKMQTRMTEHPESHANWLHNVLYNQKPFFEVAVVGTDAKEKISQLQLNYLPNSVFAGSTSEGKLGLVQNRLKKGETLIYVCTHGSCQLPVAEVDATLKQLSPQK